MRSKISGFICKNSKVIILLFLVLSAGFIFGATKVEMESNLEQFQTNAPEIKAQDYISQNFTLDQAQTTTQVVVRGDNVLSRDSLLDVLEFEKTIYGREFINETLTNQSQPMVSIANLIAIGSIQKEKLAELENKSEKLSFLKSQLEQEKSLIIELINGSKEAQREMDELNYSLKRNQISEETYEEKVREIRANLTFIDSKANKTLNASQFTVFKEIQTSVMNTQHRIDDLGYSYKLGEINSSVYQQRLSNYTKEMGEYYSQIRFLFTDKLDEINNLLSEISEIRSDLEEFNPPSIQEQINQIESLNNRELKDNISLIFKNQSKEAAINPFALMPLDFDANTTESKATMIFVFHSISNASQFGTTSANNLTEVQKEIKSLAEARIEGGEVMVFGQGLVTDEIDRAMMDSLRLVLPVALLFVLVALIIAYRDILDVFLGLFGILLVLMWTFGAMGWLGISFNQMFVAIPALLTGLSIDYAIHVFMRHREEREEHPGEGTEKAMKVALSSVGMALVWVTATTIIGFMSNVISPVPPIREFGIISSMGIFSALLILGAFIPSLKIELDSFLENRGFDRKKRAFGTSGFLKKFLSIGSWLAKNKKYLVIIIVLLLTIAGGYGATKVNTKFQQKDFLAEDPPEWMDVLPDQINPGDYSIKQNLDYLNNNFLREDQEAQILIKGDVASGNAIEALNDIREISKDKDSIIKLSSGEPRLQTPLTLMNQVANQNQSFKNLISSSDIDDDGLPEQNISEIYSTLGSIAPDKAQRVIYKANSSYEAIRAIISVKGSATSKEVTEDIRDISDFIDDEKLNATATGSPIVFNVVEKQIFSTVIESLVVALVAILAFLPIAFRLVEGSAQLGILATIPVLVIVVWIVGTMYALDIPFNIMTASITNLTIGLGIDYSIHISERFKHEFKEREEDIWAAMNKTVTGTGGALLGTAATTIGGFGVLSLAILPILKQFGTITAITMLYSFIGGVFILPSFLGLWAKSKERIKERVCEYPVIINDLTKSYGKNKALKNVDLKIPKGVFGLIGPNGAGKTTLMNILAGTIKKYSGEVKILDKNIKKSTQVRKEIGYLPENLGFYNEMTGHDYLKYMNKLSGLNEYEASRKAYKWLERLELERWGDKKISNYSAGMKQRLGIAQAFMNRPEIVLLDEPTNDLDPVAREKIIDLIREYSEDNTIIISTHVLEELREVADRFAVLKNGLIRNYKPKEEVKDLKKYYRQSIEE